jgi:carbamoyltransferase
VGLKKILGISAFYHDSAASITIGGKIIAAAEEERFTREKQAPDFPIEAVKYCLEEAGLEINDLDAIVFYDKPPS